MFGLPPEMFGRLFSFRENPFCTSPAIKHGLSKRDRCTLLTRRVHRLGVDRVGNVPDLEHVVWLARHGSHAVSAGKGVDGVVSVEVVGLPSVLALREPLREREEVPADSDGFEHLGSVGLLIRLLPLLGEELLRESLHDG